MDWSKLLQSYQILNTRLLLKRIQQFLLTMVLNEIIWASDIFKRRLYEVIYMGKDNILDIIGYEFYDMIF